MVSKFITLLLLLVFTFSISAGVSKACSWNMNEIADNTVQTKADDKPCHTDDESHKAADPEDRSQGADDCCYDMVQCQAQMLQAPGDTLTGPDQFGLLRFALTDEFTSNIVEIPPRPPRALL